MNERIQVKYQLKKILFKECIERITISAREKILNNFIGKIILAKYPEPAPEPEPEPAVFATSKPVKQQAKKSKFYKDFLDKIVHNETIINIEIFNEYLKY